MAVHILDALAREGFEECIAIHDRKSGLRAFLGIHDTTRGPAFGGMRRFEYRDERQALLDCLRLSRAMTHKCVLADLPIGGAKLVIMDRPDLDLERAYQHIGTVVERLAGRYYTGPDVGTGDAQLAWVASRTSYATDPGPAGPGELPEATAEGVFRGIQTALEHADGEVHWERTSVVVQGLGSVGERLARRLVEHGARVFGAEVDSERASALAHELGIELVSATSELDQECDVFAPCAMGGILHDLSTERLRCRIVAGGANNVLAQSRHADRLHERGVLYAPDFIVNAGALIRGCIFHLEGRREPVERVGERIASTLRDVLERAREANAPPTQVALQLAEERLAHWRDLQK